MPGPWAASRVALLDFPLSRPQAAALLLLSVFAVFGSLGALNRRYSLSLALAERPRTHVINHWYRPASSSGCQNPNCSAQRTVCNRRPLSERNPAARLVRTPSLPRSRRLANKSSSAVLR